MLKQLIRICSCGQKMIVEVDGAVGTVDLTILTGRTSRAYKALVCIEGCCVSRSHRGTKWYLGDLNIRPRGPKKLNGDGYSRAVLCLGCDHIRHLNKFEEFKT